MQPVRPIFKGDGVDPNKEDRLIIGTNSHGIFMDLKKLGVEINGYYTSFNDPDTRYANLSEGLFITWEELEKLLANRGKTRNSKASPTRVDTEVDEEYLKKLPIVHINNEPYYIDKERKERRAVNRPKEVWQFK